MMPRAVLGGLLGGIAMWIVGFIFWGTPLKYLALTQTSDAASATIQATLAQQLAATGTGAYPVPWPDTPAGTQLYGQGPVAMVLFNNSGFAALDTSALISGLILGIVCAILLAFALARVTAGWSFGGRLTIVGVFALAITTYSQLGQPVFNHAPWGYFIYMWISEIVGWIAAGAAIAWMLPKPVVVAASTEQTEPPML